MDEAGRETGFEWNTSEISASTSVFDISESVSEEQSYTDMSELVFEGNSNISHCGNRTSIESKAEQTAIFRAVPSDESIVADTVAAWEYAETSNENKDMRQLEGKTAIKKTRKRKHRNSLGSKEINLSETSESSANSLEYSAVLLAKGNQLVSSEERSEFTNSNNFATNLNLKQTLNKSVGSQILESYKHGKSNNLLKKNLNDSENNIKLAGQSHLNSTCSTSDNSYSDSSSNQSNINSTALDSDKNDTSMISEKNLRAASVLPPIPEEKKKNFKEGGKKKVVKPPPKTKSRGTQVSVKTKLVNKNAKPKRKIQNKLNKPDNNNNQTTEIKNDMIESSNLNTPETELPCTFPDSGEPELKELVERVENLLEMPGMSHQVSDVNTTSETLNVTSILPTQTIQNGSEIKLSKSCSIKIVKDANNAQQISILLPAETSLSVSKKKIKNIEDRTPLKQAVKVKQETMSPEIIDLTIDECAIEIKKEKEDDKKTTGKHSKKKEKSELKNETKREGPKKKKKSLSPQEKRNQARVTCGYVSSESSKSEDSRDSSCNCSYCAGQASGSCSCSECNRSCSCSECNRSCSCSECNRSCSCSYCAGSNSCSCSDCCSEASYESPRRRRRR